MTYIALLLAIVSAPATAVAEMRLAAGFQASVYITGTGFDPGNGVPGMPATSTLAFDHAGSLYLSRTGRRYTAGETEDIWPIYRIPLGGGRLTPETERRYFHGPPLPNAQVAAVRAGREVFVTTFDRERKVGVMYRVVDGHAELFAGGTPPKGTPPLFTQPEGAAVDRAGNVYVADRDQSRVVKLDPSGRLLDARYVTVARPRTLVMDDNDHLWIGSDGSAEAPWQRGDGEIWRVSPQGSPSVVLRGSITTAMSVDGRGRLFVADRQGATIFVVTADGRRMDFAAFTDGAAPRALVFAPDTPAIRQAGFAGQLFVVTISRGAWSVNEVWRIGGPFEQLAK